MSGWVIVGIYGESWFVWTYVDVYISACVNEISIGVGSENFVRLSGTPPNIAD